MLNDVTFLAFCSHSLQKLRNDKRRPAVTIKLIIDSYVCTDCSVPYAVIFRGSEIKELNTSPEDMEGVTLLVLNAM